MTPIERTDRRPTHKWAFTQDDAEEFRVIVDQARPDLPPELFGSSSRVVVDGQAMYLEVTYPSGLQRLFPYDISADMSMKLPLMLVEEFHALSGR